MDDTERGGTGTSVLVALQDPEAGRAFSSALEALGYRALRGSAATAADLEGIQNLSPDLVLMDPTADAQADPLRGCREVRDGCSVPAVAVLPAGAPPPVGGPLGHDPLAWVRMPPEPRELQLVVEASLREHRLAQALEKRVHFDELTRLPNRAALVGHLRRLLRRVERREGYRFALLVLDLDRFKVVNESLGPKAGDRLLVDLAGRLAGCLRGEDSVARLGGDEFAVLLDGIRDTRDAYRVARRIEESLKAPFVLDGHPFYTTASMGIAQSASGYRDPEEVLRDAETALSRAKAMGRARYEMFDAQMHSRALSQLEAEGDLRRAVDAGELILHYQPIVLLETGRIGGFEALVRWQHPQRGLVPPNEFIPLAEDTGLIVPIGQWVLEEACRQARAWQERIASARDLKMGVNLSARQFSRSDVPSMVKATVERTGFDRVHLRLEITESVVMENRESAAAMIARLKAMGIHLCMDDFGTGYSSLSALHEFPVDTLKIDRAFVSRLGSDDSATGIVQTIILLARHLRMTVVAEGIETAPQLATLRGLGCEMGQGYFFSRPLGAAAAAALLESDPRW
ncbi:MAG: bifunctional diguanylate cyclase/phosphodiesterase [Planctomycetes bacterium]|nr:bifunctional diguanylate cyclase/phosphodiesterase [Planctomycetota bacterium]